jgi:hypothetical protein
VPPQMHAKPVGETEPQVRDLSEPGRSLEARLAADEARLVEDEERLLADEEAARTTRAVSLTGVTIAGVLVIAVAALVIAVIALRQDVTAIENAAPPGSVGAAAIRESAVTADKLATGAVGTSALKHGAVTKGTIATGAVGTDELAQRAVRGNDVALDALTGAQIHEPKLARVPSAARSGTAANSSALGGAAAGAYVAHVRTVRVSTAMTTETIKGPLTASCPAGTRVISGGATVEGAMRGVSIVSSGPTKHGWTALARRTGGHSNPWRLIVTVIYAKGGT